ncbi:Asp23/Gls24 family envelope stress response protein [Nocardiopsis aegyptia]|uniref:Putative alkaline shock family protein YloU n=1 Tax=Nocardiopsis aegyptia TaxID=220378 RepID=A0A7Z0EIJ0_9ACTN|nr:Asp23/Gls24 family envelope stress response protein [Nocardiopsis aegyptia]NYJ32735.1 putative alkaline shock family protein YloU [Nocardiopsis aegyptia]
MADTNTHNSAGVGTVQRRADAPAGGDSQGRTVIADHVVAKISGMAAREVRGVHRMGGNTARAFDAVRERIPGSTSTSAADRGVAVEVGERQAAVDINLVVEYGAVIPDLAGEVRRNVVSAVERMTGLEVTEVNVAIDDIHLPDDGEDGPGAEPRVR